MEKLPKILESLANLAIVLLAVTLGYFFIARMTATPPVPPDKPETIKAGTLLPSIDVAFDKSERNLLLVLSTSCHFCTESMPFYQKLAARKAEGLRMIALMSQPPEEAGKYLSEHKVVVDEITQGNPGKISVRGTPTLLLVDSEGIVLDSWAGKLPPEKENEVMGRLFGENRASQ